MNLQNLTQKLPKPILFGIFGGLGCLLAAAIFGEMWLSLTRRPPQPQTVVLLMDTSSSMWGGKLLEVQAAATGFVDRQNLTVNNLAIVEFADNSQVLTILTPIKLSSNKRSQISPHLEVQTFLKASKQWLLFCKTVTLPIFSYLQMVNPTTLGPQNQ